eukprot:1763908-Prymnesium_polylepis.1
MATAKRSLNFILLISSLGVAQVPSTFIRSTSPQDASSAAQCALSFMISHAVQAILNAERGETLLPDKMSLHGVKTTRAVDPHSAALDPSGRNSAGLVVVDPTSAGLADPNST